MTVNRFYASVLNAVKEDIRRSLLKRRRSLSKEELKQVSCEINTHLINEIQNFKNIVIVVIYLPFSAQDLLSKNIIEIKVIDSESNWFGVTYKNDKKLSVKKLNKLTESGNYPMDLWENL